MNVEDHLCLTQSLTSVLLIALLRQGHTSRNSKAMCVQVDIFLFCSGHFLCQEDAIFLVPYFQKAPNSSKLGV